jgi:hypothetical protein
LKICKINVRLLVAVLLLKKPEKLKKDGDGEAG